MDFLKQSLKQVEKQWTQLRGELNLKKVSDALPALEEWFQSLQEGHREQARKLLTRLSTLPLDKENDRKLLYKHGILAFERMKLIGYTERLTENISDVSTLLEILAGRDALEASYYRDILRSRLDVVKIFQDKVDTNVIEKELQKYLFNNLWLLDPAWESKPGSSVMESRLVEAGIFTDDMTEKHKLARVDIAYQTNAGKHIIVELKRVGRKLKLLDLVEQGQTYVDKLKKILQKQDENSPNIEVVFVLGKPVDEESNDPNRLKASMDSISPGSRIVHYDSLIQGALNAHSEYLIKTAELDKIQKIVDQL